MQYLYKLKKSFGFVHSEENISANQKQKMAAMFLAESRQWIIFVDDLKNIIPAKFGSNAKSRRNEDIFLEDITNIIPA